MSNITPIRTAAESTLVESFAASHSRLPGSAAIAAQREKAFARFAASGLPHRRNEAWKYTDWRGLLRESAPLAGKPADDTISRALADPAAITSEDAIIISIVNGHFVGMMGDLPKGVTLTPLAEALRTGHADTALMGRMEIAADNIALALNTAFMSDGVVIRVAAGKKITMPLVLRLITDDEVALTTYVRALVVLEAGSALTLVESCETRGAAHQPNTVVEVDRKSTRLNSSHSTLSRMPSSA